MASARRYRPRRMTRLLRLTTLMFAGVLGSCNSLDVPAAPNLQPILDAYANPTAEVGSAIMSEVADEIAEAADAIEDSEILDEILQVIIDIQEDLDSVAVKTCDGGAMSGSACASSEDCPDGTCVSNGDIVVGATCTGGTNDGGDCAANADCPEGTCGGGATLPTPTGVVRVNYICPGWDERQFDPDYEADPDPEDGTINLTMTLDGAGIGRVVWGSASTCRYLVGDQNESFQASYDGGVAVDLGDDTVPTDADIAELLVTFVMEGNIGFDGEDFRINQSFRVILAAESGLELLVDLADPALSETFNYIFAGSRQILQDATGAFGCSLEESRCFNENGDTLFSW